MTDAFTNLNKVDNFAKKFHKDIERDIEYFTSTIESFKASKRLKRLSIDSLEGKDASEFSTLFFFFRVLRRSVESAEIGGDLFRRDRASSMKLSELTQRKLRGGDSL